MTTLDKLEVGQRFRVAEPDAFSLNGKPMPRNTVFKISKIYTTWPFTRVCVKKGSPLDSSNFFTLPAECRVLMEDEVLPSKKDLDEDEIWKKRATFGKLSGFKLKATVNTDLGKMNLQAKKMLSLLIASGKKEFSPLEAQEIFEKHRDFLGTVQNMRLLMRFHASRSWKKFVTRTYSGRNFSRKTI